RRPPARHCDGGDGPGRSESQVRLPLGRGPERRTAEYRGQGRRVEPVRPDRSPEHHRSGRASLKPTRAGHSDSERSRQYPTTDHPARKGAAAMAAGAPRIFVSHLSGVAVFDPNGDQVGRVRDLVAMLRVGRRPPRLLGLVVELPTRRRIFLPMTRVTAVQSGQVISTGVLNVRRFEQRPTERLVFGELLDRRVTLVDGGEEVTVLDLSVHQLPSRREWEVDRVFVRKGRKGGAFRRSKGETLTVEWSAVTGFSLEEHGQGAENLLATFEQLRPADLANVLHHLSPKRRAEVAAALDDDRLADVLEELPEDDQIEILGKLKEERAADVLEAMDPADAADLLGELPEDEQERLLSLMQPGDAADMRRLMAYEEHTAGGLMTTEPIVLRPDATVADALARIRNP